MFVSKESVCVCAHAWKVHLYLDVKFSCYSWGNFSRASWRAWLLLCQPSWEGLGKVAGLEFCCCWNLLDLCGTTGGLKPGWAVAGDPCHLQAVGCTALEMTSGVVFLAYVSMWTVSSLLHKSSLREKENFEGKLLVGFNTSYLMVQRLNVCLDFLLFVFISLFLN